MARRMRTATGGTWLAVVLVSYLVCVTVTASVVSVTATWGWM